MTAKEVIEILAKEVRNSLVSEAELQGHKLTGKLEKNLTYEVVSSDDEATATIYGPDYAIYLNYGVSAERVRYPIRVMIEYFTKRGLPMKEATSAAWATRAKHKKEGMPTKASQRFSKNGNRTGFLDDGLKNGIDKIKQLAPSLFAEYVEAQVESVFGRNSEVYVIEF
jgi:hypothetical protein